MIVYIGNIISKYNRTPTFIEFLSPKLAHYYKVKTFSSKKRKWMRLLDSIRQIIRYKSRIELVLIDTYSTLNFWYAICVAILCKFYKIPYIPILRGGDLPHRLEHSKQLSNKLFHHNAINISPSKYLLESFHKYGYTAEYIPNFIDVEDYPFKIRRAFQPKLLWVRAFHVVYNPTLAIELLKKLLETYPNASLCMVGPDKDGSMLQVQNLISTYGLTDHVELTGCLSKQEWRAKAADYDIFINTTNFDNHPVSVIEAMALGLPVITTNVGGIPYLIEHERNGILVPPNDSQCFVDQIIRLVENPSVGMRLAEQGRADTSKLDWSHVKDQWINLIESYKKRGVSV